MPSCLPYIQPVASTSKIATAAGQSTSQASTSNASTQATLSTKAKGKGKGKSPSSSGSSSEEEEDDEKEDEDDGHSSDSLSISSSSSSSFLTTSDEDEDMPVPRNSNNNNRNNALAGSGMRQGGSRLQRGHEGDDEDGNQQETTRGKRPEMTRPSDPPFVQFGADADLAYNVRAFGKPILWGLLPGDVPPSSSDAGGASLFANDNEEGGGEKDERSKAMIEQERQKASERYSRFREDYVSKMISRFGGSLDMIRQREGDTIMKSGNRLKVLIESIADGSELFSSVDGEGIWKVDEAKESGKKGEREVVLEGLEVLKARGGEEEEDERME